VSEIYPRIYPKLIRLAREYRCLGGTPRAVKQLNVKVILCLTRKRSLVRIQSCLPYKSFIFIGVEMRLPFVTSPVATKILSSQRIAA